MAPFHSTSLAWLLLAEGETAAPGFGSMLPMFVIVGVLFYVMVLMPQRREQNQRKSMLEELKKNDHVITTGGIHGTVTNVRRDDDEVTIKVDESTNTKLRVSIGAISRVITSDAKSDQ
ncbi:MAG: preprotein translocase subunit YajC [Pirellulales bacterium]|nr:preprotein translocase subunit YajC [Planctomycetales bacterium]